MSDKPTRVDIRHSIVHARGHLKELAKTLGRAGQLVQPVPDEFDPADFEDLIGGSQADRDREAGRIIDEVAGELETTALALRKLERHLQALQG